MQIVVEAVLMGVRRKQNFLKFTLSVFLPENLKVVKGEKHILKPYLWNYAIFNF